MSRITAPALPDRMEARAAQEYVARELSIAGYRVYHLLAEAGIRPFHQGMRHWYHRADLDAWMGRLTQPVENAQAVCRHCSRRIEVLGGTWTQRDEGTTNCLSNMAADWAPHEPKEATR